MILLAFAIGVVLTSLTSIGIIVWFNWDKYDGEELGSGMNDHSREMD